MGIESTGSVDSKDRLLSLEQNMNAAEQDASTEYINQIRARAASTRDTGLGNKLQTRGTKRIQESIGEFQKGKSDERKGKGKIKKGDSSGWWLMLFGQAGQAASRHKEAQGKNDVSVGAAKLASGQNNANKAASARRAVGRAQQNQQKAQELIDNIKANSGANAGSLTSRPKDESNNLDKKDKQANKLRSNQINI